MTSPLPNSILEKIASEMRTDRNGAVIDMAKELLELRTENKALIEMAHGWHIEELEKRLAAAERVVEAVTALRASRTYSAGICAEEDLTESLIRYFKEVRSV